MIKIVSVILLLFAGGAYWLASRPKSDAGPAPISAEAKQYVRNLDLAEVVSFTAARNARSEAVMRRIGLVRATERDFDHPRLAVGHPLRPHVVYVARRPPLQ